MGYIVDEPTIIYGIAATASDNPPFIQYSNYGTVYHSRLGQCDFEAYAMLVQKEGDQYYHADSARWHNQLPNRYVVYPQHRTDFPDIGDTTVSTYEFYFPEPCVVRDTFGVGIWFTYLETIDSISNAVVFSMGTVGGRNIKPQFIILEGFSVREDIYSHSYDTSRTEAIGGFFPIIAPPDTDSFECPSVENFRLSGHNREGMPTFDWDTQVGQSQFQVAYGPADGDPDSYTVLTATSRPYLLSAQDLDPTVVYAARCRGGCLHSCSLHDNTLFWSEWSDTVQFCTSALDIVPVEGGLAFTLSPNPARESVTVTVGEGIALPCTVGLRDEAGHELLRQRMEGRETTLSTKGLPAGLYLVTLDTQKGSSTQKLVVER